VGGFRVGLCVLCTPHSGSGGDADTAVGPCGRKFQRLVVCPSVRPGHGGIMAVVARRREAAQKHEKFTPAVAASASQASD